MINSGVSFQPGLMDDKQRPTSPTGSREGVQEAIKVLSLRLPKVVGAQAVAPSALLSSQGSGGRHVDSIVEQVMQKFFPGADPSPMGEAPSPMPNMGAPEPMGDRSQSSAPSQPPSNFWQNPRIIVDLPQWNGDFAGNTGDFMMGPDGRPISGGPSPSPPNTTPQAPDLRRQLDWISPPPSYEQPLI